MSKEEKKSFRVDPDKLSDLFAFYGASGDDFSETMRSLIEILHEKLLLYKKSLAASDRSSDSTTLKEELNCKLRISTPKSPSGFSCVNRPPRAVKLESLEICKVCLAVRHGLNDHTKTLGATVKDAPEIAVKATTEKPVDDYDGKKPLAIKDPSNKTFKKAGLVYCIDGGLWVYPRKCDDCKTPCDNAPPLNPFVPFEESFERQQEQSDDTVNPQPKDQKKESDR